MAQSFPSLLLHLGPEEGEKQAAFLELRGALRNAYGQDLEEHSFYAFETPPDRVVDILQNGSLFGSASLVRYRAVEQLKRKEDILPLVRYAENPSKTSVLLLESSEVSLHKDVKDAVGSRHTKIFWEMFESQKKGWLSGYFRRHDARIDPEALELLLELVENNTLDLRQEADRLMAFFGKQITLEHVDQYIYHAREESIFTLFDAILAEDLDHALDIAVKLLMTMDAVQVVLGIAWQVDRLFSLQTLRAGGVPQGKLFEEQARRSGQRIAGKRLQKSLLGGISRYSLEDCRALRVLTGDTDALLRSVPATLHGGIVQQYLYSVISRKGRWNVAAPFARRPWEFPGASGFRGV
ncbi:DNA polymerase III, delta subunit [Alkalispirochaeta americana]|uniref:DNA polymerase III, delta subunit n=1 Tax=Alkalispirochaeta americana TaxID=159291 RepID=A0A1N6U1N0_9SPIO|nr:DNA polymerase III subunit delta [Alkalispirochaeta americana]SIQ59401.1 DNA polymerase III, delta subunit [Alkalispirochaeta americana]